jgi:hypothetical protein
VNIPPGIVVVVVASAIHCAYSVMSFPKSNRAPFAYEVPLPSGAVFQLLNEKPGRVNVGARSENNVKSEGTFLDSYVLTASPELAFSKKVTALNP